MENDLVRARAYPMENRVRHYAWGTIDAIPRLLGIENAEKKPFAELWMGAHPQAPSLALSAGEALPLPELIERDPERCLGGGASVLPFLLKLLSASSPLSIQAHPSREEAVRGYELEEKAGVPVDSPERLYRDRNHKPEIIAALGPFDALCGFRPRGEIARNLALLEGEDGALDGLVSRAYAIAASEEGFRGFFDAHFAVPADDRGGLVAGARRAALKRLEFAGLGEGQRKALETLIVLSDSYPEDPGVLAALYLNLVRLERLDALSIPHGALHAYLAGTGVELMASSDNVLRGGLTPKKVDPEGLVSILSFDFHAPEILRPAPPNDAGWSAYASPYPDFSLALLDGEARASRGGERPEILFCVEGGYKIDFDDRSFELSKGASIFIPARSGTYAMTGTGLAFRASTGDQADKER